MLPIWATDNESIFDEQMEGDLLNHFTDLLMPKGEVDAIVSQTVRAQACLKAEAAANYLKERSERVFYRLLYKNKKGGYFRYTAEEYETLEEYLVDRYIEFAQKPPARADVLFLMDHFLPLLDKIGGEWMPEKVLAIQEHFSKTRAAVPGMRKIFNEFSNVDEECRRLLDDKEKERKQTKLLVESLPPDSPKLKQAKKKLDAIEEYIPKLEQEVAFTLEEAKEKFNQDTSAILDLIKDPSVYAEGPGGVREIVRTGGKPIIITGSRLEAPERVYFSVSVPVRSAQLIEQALKNIVEFRITDPRVVISDLTETFKRKGK